MMVENFVRLSVEEQVTFAKALLDKINSENIFLDETTFKFDDVELDDCTEGLFIYGSLANPVSVKREVSWTAGTEEGAEEDPGNNAEYVNSLRVDTETCFKTFITTVDGYSISLRIDDIEEDETVDEEIEISHLSHEDDGIGSYEYWGFKGYDSHPYVDVKGTVTRKCDCNITFSVEPKDIVSKI